MITILKVFNKKDIIYTIHCNIKYPVTGHILDLNLHIKFIYCFNKRQTQLKQFTLYSTIANKS